jgi:hypothetical protein
LPDNAWADALAFRLERQKTNIEIAAPISVPTALVPYIGEMSVQDLIGYRGSDGRVFVCS